MTKFIRYYRKHTAIPLENQEGGIIQHNKTTDESTFRLSPNIVRDCQFNNNWIIRELTPKEIHHNYWIFDMASSLEKCHVMMSRLTVWGLLHNFQGNIPYALKQLSSNPEYQEILFNYVKFIECQSDITATESFFVEKIYQNDLTPKDITILANSCRKRYTTQCNKALCQLENHIIQQSFENIFFEAHDVVSIGIKSYKANTINTLVIHIAIANAEDIMGIYRDEKTLIWDDSYFQSIFQDIGSYDLIAVHKSANSVFKHNLISLCKNAGIASPNIQEFIIGMDRQAQRKELEQAKNKDSELLDDIVNFLGDTKVRLFCGGRADLNKGSDLLIEQLDELLIQNPKLKNNIKIVYLLQETHTKAPGYKLHIDKDIIPAVENFKEKHPDILYFRLGKYIPHGKYMEIMSKFNGYIFTASDSNGEGHNLHISEIAVIKNETQKAINKSFIEDFFAILNIAFRRFTNYFLGNRTNFNFFIVVTKNIGAAEVYKDGLFVAETMADISRTILTAINASHKTKVTKTNKLMKLAELYDAKMNAKQLKKLAQEAKLMKKD